MIPRAGALAVLAFGIGVCNAAPPIYDEAADAKADIRAALQQAAQSNREVLLVFGANWCADCRILDQSFKQGATAGLVDRRFKVVKVDVGRFDRNVDIASGYGVPLKKGIPTIAVLSAKGDVLYATRAGELADARAMGDEGIRQFFGRMPSRQR